MNHLLLILAALTAATPALADDGALKAPATQDCLVSRNILQAQAGFDGKWYARLRNGNWWRNSMNCPILKPRRALVHTSPIGSQCRGDIVNVVDFSAGGVFYGGCGLGTWERVASPPPKPPKRPESDD